MPASAVVVISAADDMGEVIQRRMRCGAVEVNKHRRG
jgi:response regulator of citrate/malate metabolism